MPLKYTPLNDALYQYMCTCRSNADDPIGRDLRAETEALGESAKMQISEEQIGFMTLLVAALGVTSALELGTFTGSSALAIARGLPPSGRLLCLDLEPKWTDVARRYWVRAGVADKIELRLGPALDSLANLESSRTFDFAFVDAEKTEYDAYYELILPRIRPNGLILFDNMLWGGRLGSGPVAEPSGQAIDRLNRKLAADSRVECVLIPVADGIQLCRKR